ncbi:Protein RIK [Camellia lanceoleosa]|uniref:Protein RIK n=1 Tax=Camellia lanceoleosa TaxID=1840588 RepID=A0ACC0IHZ4_9ERIC|nr:Protein RIK [Camellia lanceoleosa]
MNETGATVLLRGRGSGNSEKCIWRRKTAATAFILVKVLSSKVYGAVPPPHQLLNGVQSSGNEMEANNSSAASLTSVPVNSIAIPPISLATHLGITTTLLQGTLSQSIGLSYGHSQPNMVCYPHPSLSSGTSYSGYGQIYPQATPL